MLASFSQSQSSTILRDNDHGSGSCPGSVGTTGRGRHHDDVEGLGVVPTGGQCRPDILLFPYVVFVHSYENAAIVL